MIGEITNEALARLIVDEFAVLREELQEFKLSTEERFHAQDTRFTRLEDDVAEIRDVMVNELRPLSHAFDKQAYMVLDHDRRIGHMESVLQPA